MGQGRRRQSTTQGHRGRAVAERVDEVKLTVEALVARGRMSGRELFTERAIQRALQLTINHIDVARLQPATRQMIGIEARLIAAGPIL